MDKGRYIVKLILVFLVLHSVDASIDEPFDDDDEDLPHWSRCPFIRNKLKNGRVKIRSRGRIAKFLCDPGFELAGKRFATCVRGQWNNPIPVCVSRGCFRHPAVANARVSEMYRGAVLLYECLPGYTMFGGATVYCDGRQWSSEAPKCEVATTNPQLSCDFEDPALCGWSHDPTHDFDWKRNQFATPSGHVGTGPSSDHTFGPGKGGFYLYMEASSPRKENDTARLFSPVYPKEMSGGCFVVWYHMFGSTTGTLRVYVKPESHVFAELLPTWFISGDQGNQWLRRKVIIPHLNENFQIVIEGVRGSSYIGDTAIDDVSLHSEDCDLIGNSTDQVTVSVPTSCRGRCREINESYPCGCDDNCVISETCCGDFFGICTKGPESEGTENPEEKSASTTTSLPVKTKTSTKYDPEPTTMGATSIGSFTSEVPSTYLTNFSKLTEEYTTTRLSTPSNAQFTVTMPKSTTASSPKVFSTSPESSTMSITASVLSTVAFITSTLNSTTPTAIPAMTSTTPATTSTTPVTSSTTSVTTSTTFATTSTTSATASTTPATTSTTPATTSTTPATTSTTPDTLSTTPETSSTGFFTLLITSIKTSPTFQTTTIVLFPNLTRTSPTPTISYTPSSKALTLLTGTSTKPSTTSLFTMSTKPSTSSTTQSRSSATFYTTSTKHSVLYSTSRPITHRSTLFTKVMPLTTKKSVTPSTASPSSTSSVVTVSKNPVPHYFYNISTKSSARYSTENPTTLATEQTRKTYNLRPRLTSTKRTYFPRYTSSRYTTRSRYISTSQMPSTKLVTTEMLSTTTQTISMTTMVPPAPKEVPLSSETTSTASDDSRSTVAIVSVTLLVIVCFAGGLFIYLRKWRASRQSKLAEDSEMRFLYENEVAEYSDCSELDRINFNPPLI